MIILKAYPDSKIHGANMGPIWDRQDTGYFLGSDVVPPMSYQHLVWGDIKYIFIFIIFQYIEDYAMQI